MTHEQGNFCNNSNYCIAGITAYAISPYFTESSVDEALPSGAITQPIKDSSSAVEKLMSQ